MNLRMMTKAIFILLVFLNTLSGIAQNTTFFSNTDSLVSLMTLEEKITFISGYKNFNIKGLKRLGIPQIKMADGPMGVKPGKATAFPASICMSATWNPGLIKEMSGAIAVEATSKGVGILLAPGVNMYRIPHCGRNFEYFGEDPFLTSRMTVSFIQGVQNKNIMATVKHFVANNQDYDRHRVSSNVDERTLHEIYFPAFKAAVQEANVGAVMTSYNPLNGVYTSESSYLIKEILKEKWGFDGIVISDWLS
ncbi:glycoside hydrolase family 3 protein, partial [bacterium]|nr:glycoside hydrolase family 3 protein [bacterium]